MLLLPLLLLLLVPSFRSRIILRALLPRHLRKFFNLARFCTNLGGRGETDQPGLLEVESAFRGSVDDDFGTTMGPLNVGRGRVALRVCAYHNIRYQSICHARLWTLIWPFLPPLLDLFFLLSCLLHFFGDDVALPLRVLTSLALCKEVGKIRCTQGLNFLPSGE